MFENTSVAGDSGSDRFTITGRSRACPEFNGNTGSSLQTRVSRPCRLAACAFSWLASGQTHTTRLTPVASRPIYHVRPEDTSISETFSQADLTDSGRGDANYDRSDPQIDSNRGYRDYLLITLWVLPDSQKPLHALERSQSRTGRNQSPMAAEEIGLDFIIRLGAYQIAFIRLTVLLGIGK